MFLTQRHALKTNLWYMLKMPQGNHNSVDENPANESYESSSETKDKNNVILPRRSIRARKPIDGYGDFSSRLYDLKENHGPFSCYGRIKANSAGKNVNVTNSNTKVAPLIRQIGVPPNNSYLLLSKRPPFG